MNKKISIIAILVIVIGLAVAGIIFVARLPLSGDSKPQKPAKPAATVKEVKDEEPELTQEEKDERHKNSEIPKPGRSTVLKTG